MYLVTNKLKWDIRQRMKLIEAALVWTGNIGRKDLINAFQLSEIQASKDLTHYQKLCPGNIEYNRSLKTYVPTSEFNPLFIRDSGFEFLNLLKSVQTDEKSPVVVLLSTFPAMEILSPPERTINSKVLRKINLAIQKQFKVSILYQSMGRGTPRQLIISPHTLVYNGFRWHIRAYSEAHKEFRDFLIARISGDPDLIKRANITVKTDKLWKTQVTVKIGPHPGLNDNQQEQIKNDFGMKRGVLKKRLRAALVPYYTQMMRVGMEDESMPPEKQQIILINKQEIEPFLF